MERKQQDPILTDYESAADRLEHLFRREALAFWPAYQAAHPLPKRENPSAKAAKEDGQPDEGALLAYMQEAFLTGYTLGKWEWLHSRRGIETLTQPRIPVPSPATVDIRPESPPSVPPEFCRDGEAPPHPPKSRR